MTKIYSYTKAIKCDIVDAFCALQTGFTDQFVYYDKAHKSRVMGLGRCIALWSLHEVDCMLQGEAMAPSGAPIQPIFFSFNRFDAENPKSPDELFNVFPKLKLMLPEVVLIENTQGTFLQVNSLGPIYNGRVDRFIRKATAAPKREQSTIAYKLEPDSKDNWSRAIACGTQAIGSGSIDKVVLSRRQKLIAERPFSSNELLANLIDGSAHGVVLLYRYGDVFFCGCTPELLIRKCGSQVESMCLAGTTKTGANEAENKRLASALLADNKNLREHAYVVDFIREVFKRNCHNVAVGDSPQIMTLKNIQHLHTPVSAEVRDGVSLTSLMKQLHPTPALSGSPVGEAMMLIRQIEDYNRGFYGGACGYVDASGNGEFSVALRSGVFDGEIGWVYAGCGIVSGSDADAEFEEIELKLKTILSAFGGQLKEAGDSA